MKISGGQPHLQIEEQLARMDERSPCDRLEADANALAHAIIVDNAEKDDQYDVDTDNGRCDGAQFP